MNITVAKDNQLPINEIRLARAVIIGKDDGTWAVVTDATCNEPMELVELLSRIINNITNDEYGKFEHRDEPVLADTLTLFEDAEGNIYPNPTPGAEAFDIYAPSNEDKG